MSKIAFLISSNGLFHHFTNTDVCTIYRHNYMLYINCDGQISNELLNGGMVSKTEYIPTWKCMPLLLELLNPSVIS